MFVLYPRSMYSTVFYTGIHEIYCGMLAEDDGRRFWSKDVDCNIREIPCFTGRYLDQVPADMKPIQTYNLARLVLTNRLSPDVRNNPIWNLELVCLVFLPKLRVLLDRSLLEHSLMSARLRRGSWWRSRTSIGTFKMHAQSVIGRA